MNPRTKISLAMLLLLMFLSAGMVEGSNHVGTNPLHKGGMGAKSRKLLGMDDIVLDYDCAGANGKHDPRGRRGGKGP